MSGQGYGRLEGEGYIKSIQNILARHREKRDMAKTMLRRVIEAKRPPRGR